MQQCHVFLDQALSSLTVYGCCPYLKKMQGEVNFCHGVCLHDIVSLSMYSYNTMHVYPSTDNYSYSQKMLLLSFPSIEVATLDLW